MQRGESRVRLRGDVTVDVSDDGVLTLACPVGAYALRAVAPGVVEALRALAGASVRDAEEPAARLPDAQARQLRTILRQLGDLFVRAIEGDGRLLAEVEVTRRHARYVPASMAPGTPVRLSRFALLRAHGGTLALESPSAGHRFLLRDPAAVALVGALGGVGGVGGPYVAGTPVAGLGPGAAEELLGHLVGAGFAQAAGPEGEDAALRHWEFHDLLAHTRSRVGGFDHPLGAVPSGTAEPEPAVKAPPEGRAIPLHRPDLDAVAAADPPLTTVIETRRSVRRYGEQPLTAEQLGTFLYRTARVRAGTTGRPYPSGGGAHDLELYLTVRRCAGVEPGLYYYDPAGHRLVLVNADPGDLAAMAASAAAATRFTAEPDVVLTVTSRFRRLSWRYRGIAYSLALKHVGVLHQTMYLVATAMGLAPCALGSGDSELAARVLGLDPLTEPAVGEFLLGSGGGPAGAVGAPG